MHNFRLRLVFQNYQLGLAYKHSANLQIVHAFALSPDSADNSKFDRAQNANCAQVCPNPFSKFVECAHVHRTYEREDFAHHFSRKLIFLGANILTQSHLHINQQHLLCTSCECEVNWKVLLCILKKRNPPHKQLLHNFCI